MILHMIQLEPESRLSAESYLQSYMEVVFPTYFSPFLHNLYCCCNPLHSDMRVNIFVILYLDLITSYNLQLHALNMYCRLQFARAFSMRYLSR